MSDTCYPGVLANSGPAPPPPPPPPPVAGQVPALRISTASEVSPRRGLQQQEAYEPPAAIQNAMMSKDKKPFTYTPGMGGKLDLSQIRSPRMARRVAKNANDEGIEGPPKHDQPDSPYTPTSPQQPNIYSHPQVAVQVFPQAQQAATQLNLRNSCLPRNSVADRAQIRVETNRVTPASEQSPTPPTSPTQVTLAKAPTPWMQKQVKPQEELPEWAKRTSVVKQQEDESPRVVMRTVPASPTVERNVPLRIEDRPSVFSAINEPGLHHQFVNSNPHHMSRWGNPVGQSGYQAQPTAAAYVVPVQHETHNHQNQYRSPNDNRNAPQRNQQSEPSPLQSQSFRVLQKITDTYPDQLDAEQLRKLQLTEDDRYLMNKFKEQVDADTYLHQEEDPRYRGAAIPSRAFRYLQTMTDSADVPGTNSTTRPVNSPPKKSNRQSNTFVEVPAQPYIPASQQQVQEPKKYTGGAIPSRSFRILQQMTTPESIGCPWRYNSSTATVPSYVEGQTFSSPISEDYCESNSYLDRCNEQQEEEEEEKEEEDVKEKEIDSSDSSCDSESYLVYSTGLNPSNQNRHKEEEEATSQLEAKKEDEEDGGDSTDYEKISQFEDDNCELDKSEETKEEDENEDGEMTVSVSLPLRSKRPVADDDKESLTEDVVVDFTLKRASSREIDKEKSTEPEPLQTPKFVVTESTDDAIADEQIQDSQSIAERALLRSTQSTDDEDSGVCTSEIRRADSSECHPKSKYAKSRKKYERTQTHSRLFKLLSDEQLLRESSPMDRNKLKPRPQSLDICRMNLRCYDQPGQHYSYYQTGKEPQIQAPLIYPRSNVFCPRIKNIPRIVVATLNDQRQSCMRNSATITPHSATPIRLNRRC